MRTSEQIVAEIKEQVGFLPSFLVPAQQNPQVIENLWQQTLFAYINNPLPALFKEKLSAYLSCYSGVPYCTIYDSSTLRQLGMKSLEVLKFLESPPPTVTNIDEHLRRLAEQTKFLTWQESSALEESLLFCSIFIAIEQGSAHCRQQLRQILEPANYHHLVTFIAYIKTCHEWLEAYPEVAAVEDADVLDNCKYQRFKWIQGSSRPEQTAEGDVWDSLLMHIAERKQAEEKLQQLTIKLESLVAERTDQLQQALEFEAMLKRITDKVRDSLDESQILQTVVQEMVLVLGASCCNTSLYDPEQGTSLICYEYATSHPAAQARTIQMTNFTEVYQLLLQGQYCQFCSIFPNPVRGRVAMLACPIVDGERVVGDLWLINRQDHAFDELEIRLVQQVANQCAIAIRQARLHQAVHEQVAELEKLNRLKDDFLSTVSHELRTPLTNMRMALYMLNVSPTPERQERYLEILEAECNREGQLIDDLLDLQRLEATSYSILLNEAVNIQDWLPAIVEPFHIRAGQRQQTLQLNLASDLPTLFSDHASLARILAELLNNACKYTAGAGEIVLSVHYKSVEAATVLTVSNSTDIPAAELPKIFEKFYRVPNADPWQQGGTGLGLALVQSLVNQLQGTISVESSGGWTIFTVQLPNQPSPLPGT